LFIDSAQPTTNRDAQLDQQPVVMLSSINNLLWCSAQPTTTCDAKLNQQPLVMLSSINNHL
jgi:hypothetical protein